MKLKMIAALGLAALSVALPSAASAQSSAPVLLAMASFAGSHAGTDAAREVEAKKAVPFWMEALIVVSTTRLSRVIIWTAHLCRCRFMIWLRLSRSPRRRCTAKL